MSALMDREQLSFEVGGEPPNAGGVKVSGKLDVGRQLDKGDEVRVQVIDARGEVVAEGEGYVTTIAFADKRDPETRDVVETSRTATVKLGA